MIGVQNKWELLTDGKDNKRTEIKTFLVSFMPFSKHHNKYSYVSAKDEKKALKIARAQFGNIVSAIYPSNAHNEHVLKNNFNFEKLPTGINVREL